MAQTRGLIAKLFIDLGDKFKIQDVDGEEYQEIMIKDVITNKETKETEI